MIKIYGTAPDISHLPKKTQNEIKKQIRKRIREIKKDMAKACQAKNGKNCA